MWGKFNGKCEENSRSYCWKHDRLDTTCCATFRAYWLCAFVVAQRFGRRGHSHESVATLSPPPPPSISTLPLSQPTTGSGSGAHNANICVSHGCDSKSRAGFTSYPTYSTNTFLRQLIERVPATALQSSIIVNILTALTPRRKKCRRLFVWNKTKTNTVIGVWARSRVELWEYDSI